MINWVLPREEAALEMEMTLFAKAWMCGITGYHRDCRVPGKLWAGLCDYGGGVGEGWGKGCWSLAHQEDFVSCCRSYFRVLFRLALQFRQRPLVVVWRAYGQGRFLEEAAVFVFQGPNKDGPAPGSKERLARGTSWLGSQQDFVTPCGVRKRW